MEDGKVEVRYDYFMELIEEKESAERASIELDEILDCIFEGASLSYDKKSLYFSDNDLEGYLKIKEPIKYKNKLKELQEKEKKDEKEN